MGANITISSPAATGGGVNWLGLQLIARGTVTFALSAPHPAVAQCGTQPVGPPPPPPPPPLPITCELQVQNTGVSVATGQVTCNPLTVNSWWARFGPLTNVDNQTQYQIVATYTSPSGIKTATVQALSFNAAEQIAFPPTVQTGATFPPQFSVIGTYGPPGNTARCYLLNGMTTVAVGTVQMDQPSPGQWTASFNVNGPQQGCSLVAELWSAQPVESIAAVWCDNVNIGP